MPTDNLKEQGSKGRIGSITKTLETSLCRSYRKGYNNGILYDVINIYKNVEKVKKQDLQV